MFAAVFQQSGAGLPILVILALLSLVSLTVILVKTARLWTVTGGGEGRGEALAALGGGRLQAARELFSAGRAPADRVAAQAVAMLEAGSPRKTVEAELARLGNAEVAAMNRHIRLLELIAMISPLLGLLGTVLGMIQSFLELELAAGAANASVLAGGIWQALVTTAAGLIVAIPAAVGASLLAARVEAGALAIEDVGAAILVRSGGEA